MNSFVKLFCFLFFLFFFGHTSTLVAQNLTRLKASYQGSFLPDATEIVVLRKQATIQQGELYQPEMFSASAYPQSTDLFLRRDALNASLQSLTTYPTTQSSGQLYYIYARTPDGALYWSYSAPSGQLKFDVVTRGVMSVAPVNDDVIEQRIIEVFFTDSLDNLETAPPVEATPESTLAGNDSIDMAASVDTGLSSTPGFDSLRNEWIDQDSLETHPPADVEIPATDQSATRAGISYGLFIAVVVILLAFSAGLLYFMKTYRNELVDVRTELVAARMQVKPDHPDRGRDLEQKLAEADEKLCVIREQYRLLKARYLVLEGELKALQKDQDGKNKGATL